MSNNEIQSSLSQLSTLFKDSMAEFEEKLKRSKSPVSDLTALTNEFSVFKSFMAKSLRLLQEQFLALASEVDRLEMRGRRKIILIHGVPEASQEDVVEAAVQCFSNKMKIPGISKTDMSRCHRMGRSTSDRPRPILCKVREVSLRDKIWASKTALKNSGVTLSEFLTKARHDTFMEARKRFGVTKCWTQQGFVFVVGADGSRHRVSNVAELSAVTAPMKDAAVPAPTKDTTGQSRTRRVAPKK